MGVLLVVVACGGGGSSAPDDGSGVDGGSEATDCPNLLPEMLAISNNFIADDTHFYFASSTQLTRAPIADPAAIEVVTELPASLGAPIAMGAGELFFVAGTTAFHVAKSGGTPVMLGEVPGQVTEVATDNTALYVSTVTDSDIEIRRVFGGTSTILALATTDGVEGLASDGTHVYWVPFQNGRLVRVAVTGGTPEVVADSADGVVANITNLGFAMAGDDLVWTATYQSFSDGRLFSIPKQGGERRTLSRTGTLTGLRVVEEHAYVALTGGAESAIAKVPLDGSPRTIVGCVPDRVLGFQANATGIYVIADGALLRFPR